MIIGDSTKVLQKDINVYDLIHIDGGHSIGVASLDIINSYKCSKVGTIFVFDDYHSPPLKKLWDYYVHTFSLQSVDNEHLIDNPYHSIKIRK